MKRKSILRNIQRVKFSTKGKNLKEQEAVKEIYKDCITHKYCLYSFLKAQNAFKIVPYENILRELKRKERKELDEIIEKCKENNIGPPLNLPINRVGSTVLGEEKMNEIANIIEKVLEENYDNSLRILNENELSEKELRKSLCQMRDEGYEITKTITKEDSSRTSTFLYGSIKFLLGITGKF